MTAWLSHFRDIVAVRNILQRLKNSLDEILRESGDILVTDNTKGFVVKDRTNGNYYRIYTDGGTVLTETVASP